MEKAITADMLQTYGDHCTSNATTKNWLATFEKGRTDGKD